ncbi:MAG: tetratricopeptide (TPR) repeat protein, partial [Myxococcota bacterium]
EGLIELRIQRMVRAGQEDQARELAVEALNQYPRRAPLHMLMARMAEGRGEAAMAERHFERAAEADIHDAEALMELARIYGARGDIEPALEKLKEASTRAPFDPVVLGKLISAQQQTGKVKEATANAQLLAKRFPDMVDGPLLLAELALGEGNFGAAIAVLDAAIPKHPRDSDLYTLKYFAHHAMNDPDEATKAMDRLVQVDPQGRTRIAQQLLQAGQVEAAAQLMEQELAVNPKQLDVAITLGQLHALGGDPKAVVAMRKHVETHAGERAEELLKIFDQAVAEIQKQAQDPEMQPDGAAPTP